MDIDVVILRETSVTITFTKDIWGYKRIILNVKPPYMAAKNCFALILLKIAISKATLDATCHNLWLCIYANEIFATVKEGMSSMTSNA